MRLASPSLSALLDAITARRVDDDRKVRRATLALMRYLLRATGRSTPFGFFAGTAPASFGEKTRLRWGLDHRAVTRPDPEWLHQAVTDLEAVPEAAERLHVVADDRIRLRGDHYELTHGKKRIEVRRTEAVRLVLEAASTPITVSAVADRLCAHEPSAPREAVAAMIRGLLTQGFLVSELRAPGTTPDVLGHVLEHLDRAQIHKVRAAAPVLDQLRKAETDPASTAAPLRIDLQLDCDLTLPNSVAEEAAVAATALVRLSPHPGGDPGWRDYYTEFVHRYGAGTVVPLADLLDRDMGLGYPATYPGTRLSLPRERTPNFLARQERLLVLAQRAAVLGQREVVLDDADLDGLAVAEVDSVRVPPHVEAAVTVFSASPADLDADRYTLRLRPARAIGTMTGRIQIAGSPLAAAVSRIPVTTAGAFPAQMSFAPLTPAADQVARTPRFLDHVLALGEHRPEGEPGVLTAADLGVLADRTRLYLVHTPTGRIVEPQMMHGLSLDSQTPALARFLANFTRGLCASYQQFPWGDSGLALPFLPRIRYRRTILASARWMLTRDDAPLGRDREQTLKAWRHQWRVPDAVGLVHGDRVLPVDLEAAAHRALVLAHLDRHGRALLTEVPDPDADLGWIGGHEHEVVVPLVTTLPPSPSPLERVCPVTVTDRERGDFPGSEGARWVFAKVYTHPHRQNEILTHHLPALLNELGDPPWWFLRYREPRDADHLRLRIRVGSSQETSRAVTALGSWAERLRDSGLSPRLAFDTYRPESGRYGSGPCLEAAEALFTTESAVVLDRLARGATDATALAAAMMVHTVRSFTGGTWWLLGHREDKRADASSAHVQQRAAELAAHPTHPDLHRALITYRTRLDERPGPDPDTVCSSLLHMLHNRVLGIDRAGERTCYRTARQVALTWHHRAERART
ncbi:lantibiotic dehydratase [Nocardiopsis quinghaiensis]|uniref:lantibiotic dehydratase n=1 Tax=Nocardiopsis quinghaiensis TaxID=464995 RepID=UPI0016811201|nr:lantibiotic dehydratase [Nocardiopsis quinghaiensis]